MFEHIQRPFGRRTPFNPLRGKYLGVGGEKVPFDIVLVKIDRIERDYFVSICGKKVFLPYIISGEALHDTTVNGTYFCYNGDGSRTVTPEGEESFTEYLTPEYMLDEVVMVIQYLGQWYDLNFAGRSWVGAIESSASVTWARVKTELSYPDVSSYTLEFIDNPATYDSGNSYPDFIIDSPYPSNDPLIDSDLRNYLPWYVENQFVRVYSVTEGGITTWYFGGGLMYAGEAANATLRWQADGDYAMAVWK